MYSKSIQPPATCGAPQDCSRHPAPGGIGSQDPDIAVSGHAEERQPVINFNTSRLVIRPPEESDVEPLMAMDADPEVRRYMGDGTVIRPDRDRALRAIARWRKQWDEQGFGWCSVIVRETGEYAGWVTLAVPVFLPEILPAVEIGYQLPRHFWGRGYATEAAAELLRFGFTGVGLDRIVSIRHIDNVRSERVMDKLGLRFEFQTTVPATGQPVAVHAIARQEFSAHDGSGAARPDSPPVDGDSL
jgi:RimJ/RimL family protein N-acetyltransferase